jgi:hypothetical protein
MFTDPLPSNIRPIFARVGSRRNVFTESLPSSGSIRHGNKILDLLRFSSVKSSLCTSLGMVRLQYYLFARQKMRGNVNMKVGGGWIVSGGEVWC